MNFNRQFIDFAVIWAYLLAVSSPSSYINFVSIYIVCGVVLCAEFVLKRGFLLGWAMRVGARLLLANTSEVYGDPQVHPQPEIYRRLCQHDWHPQ